MADDNHSDLLNRLLVRLYRGLLPYAVECWPWSAAAEAGEVEPAQQRAIEKMAARRQQRVARLVELLSRRRAVVDFGVYPDNSHLHYVSVDFLVEKLLSEQERLVDELELARAGLADDSEAAQVISATLVAEKENLSQLRELKRRTPEGVSP